MSVLPESLRSGFGVFLCALVIPLAFALRRYFPYLLDGDEYAILGSAAFLAGLDWQAAPMPYYGFLASLLTAPLYLLDIDSVTRYRTTLSCNAFMVALSAWMTFQILRSLFPERPKGYAFLITIAAYLSPTAIFLSSLALGESVLLFVFTCTLYFLARLLAETGSRATIINACLLGMCAAAVCFAHSRGVIILLSASLTVFIALSLRRISAIHAALAGIICFITYSILGGVKTYLLAEFYNEITVPSNSVTELLRARSDNFIDADSTLKLLRVAFGQIFYLNSSTYGLWFVCMVLLLRGQRQFWRGFPYRAEVQCDDMRTDWALLVTFLLVSIVGVYSAGVLLLSPPDRADHYFYGRYNEVFVPATLALALVGATQCGSVVRLRFAVLAVVSVILMAIVVRSYPPDVFDLKVYYAQIAGWFMHRHGSWKIDPFRITASIVLVQCLLALIALKNFRWFLIGFMAVNACASFYLFENLHRKVDDNWKDFAQLDKSLKGRLDGATIGVIGGKIKHPPALQIALPKSSVIFDPVHALEADYYMDYTSRSCGGKFVVLRLNDSVICRARALASP